MYRMLLRQCNRARGDWLRGRLPFAATVALSLTIGLGAGMTAWRTVSLDQTSPASSAADPATGYVFYDKLDRVLAGDDGVGLEGIVTDDFVDHSGEQATGQSIDELVERMLAFGETFPGARLDIDSIEATGESLIAVVTPVAPVPGKVAGLAIEPVQLTGNVEILHIRRGRISERWALPLPSISTTTFAAASTTMYEEGPVHAGLYRIELPPGGEFSWITTGLSAVMVEDGNLSLTVEDEDELGRIVSQREDVESGSATLLPAVAHVRLRGKSMQTTRVLLFDAFRADRETPWPFKRTGGTTSKLLWSSSMPLADSGPWRFEIGNVAVPLNSQIALRNPSRLEIVLEASGAPVKLDIEEGTMEHLDEKYEISLLALPSIVEAGKAAQLSGADSIVLSGSDDAGSIVWLITIDRLDAQEPAGATPEPPPGRPGARR